MNGSFTDHRTKLCLFSILFTLSLAAPAQPANSFRSVYISEFLADNQHGLKDEDGECSPWIELYNGGRATINLNGWFLTDTAANLTKWRLPQVALLPDKYMVIFSSGKNRTKDLAHLHTNFRLEQQGSFLALVGPAANVISKFAA